MSNERAQIIEADVTRPAVSGTTPAWIQTFFRIELESISFGVQPRPTELAGLNRIVQRESVKKRRGDKRFRVIALGDVSNRPGWIIDVVSVTVGLFELGETE
ncbi:hypothetical protein WH47_04831 [Habropoda laboriosa]|uniref:Uncharacterized protein n=1 Tax=Habropoda laboriosa TaxID=597456 RepID=A0A0L7QVR9_9HYME|nr:hypothetical protein WH47_04831 [Habropoda laboriosa]